MSEDMRATHVLSGEIIEEGVTLIELSASSTFNRTFVPSGQRVKWFRDGLSQLWVKFQTDNKQQTVTDHVWPASRVVQVQYDKSRS